MWARGRDANTWVLVDQVGLRQAIDAHGDEQAAPNEEQEHVEQQRDDGNRQLPLGAAPLFLGLVFVRRSHEVSATVPHRLFPPQAVNAAHHRASVRGSVF